MNTTALDFLVTHHLDREIGGVFPVCFPNGSPLVSDKDILSQAWSTLALTHAESITSLDTAAEGLRRLAASEALGFNENSDRYFTLQPIGQLRTTRSQLIAAEAALAAGSRLSDSALMKQGISVVEQVAGMVLQGHLPRCLREDFDRSLDGTHDLSAMARFTLAALVLPEAWTTSVMEATQTAVQQLISLGNATISHRPFPTALRRLEIIADVTLALTKASISTHLDSSIDVLATEIAAQRLLVHCDRLFHDKELGGFWDWIRDDGSVGLDPVESYHIGNALTPKKVAGPLAQILTAANFLRTDIDVRARLRNAIADLTDSKNGGVFCGESYFWGGPNDPVVPFQRQFWPEVHTSGEFWIGNLSYLPLQEKNAITQAQVALLESEQRGVNNATPVSSDTATKNSATTANDDRRSLQFEGSLHIRGDHDIADSAINLDAYRNWLHQTQPAANQPFGLTTLISPVGYRNDRSGQMFATAHVIADLKVMGEEIPNSDYLVTQICSCQNADGGFGEAPGHISDIFTTYCALVSLEILGHHCERPSDAGHYVLSAQNSDGGFGDVPGMRSDLWSTSLAVISNQILGVDWEASKQQCVGWVENTYDPTTGGYSNRPGQRPDTYSFYRAMTSLGFLGQPLHSHSKAASWIKYLQTPSGGFRFRPGKPESLVATYHAVAGLALVNTSPVDPRSCENWLRSYQSRDGGFGAGGLTNTTDDGFCALQTLYILRKKLNRFWIAAMN